MKRGTFQKLSVKLNFKNKVVNFFKFISKPSTGSLKKKTKTFLCILIIINNWLKDNQNFHRATSFQRFDIGNLFRTFFKWLLWFIKHLSMRWLFWSVVYRKISNCQCENFLKKPRNIKAIGLKKIGYKTSFNFLSSAQIFRQILILFVLLWWFSRISSHYNFSDIQKWKFHSKCQKNSG